MSRSLGHVRLGRRSPAIDLLKSGFYRALRYAWQRRGEHHLLLGIWLARPDVGSNLETCGNLFDQQ